MIFIHNRIVDRHEPVWEWNTPHKRPWRARLLRNFDQEIDIISTKRFGRTCPGVGCGESFYCSPTSYYRQMLKAGNHFKTNLIKQSCAFFKIVYSFIDNHQPVNLHKCKYTMKRSDKLLLLGLVHFSLLSLLFSNNQTYCSQKSWWLCSLTEKLYCITKLQSLH